MSNIDWSKMVTAADKFVDAKARKLSGINSACEKELSNLQAKYPESEVISWDKQEREARAYLADSHAQTPLLDTMASARSMDKTELANRIIAKADAYTEAVGLAIGKRQALEDQIQKAETAAELEAIQWS